MSFETETTVHEEDAGIRLDRWFKRHHPQVSFTLIARLTRTGKIRLDGKRLQPSDRLQAGQLLCYPAKLPTRPEQKTGTIRDKPLSKGEVDRALGMIVHKDECCIVINKPPGLATQGGTKTTTHVDRLLDAYRFDREDRPKLVHRLDKETSGLLLIARSAFSAQFFADQFASGAVVKTYWALVHGKPDPAWGTIVAPLSRQARHGHEKMTVDDSGQEAQTRFKILRNQEQNGQCFSWLELRPITGRMHQLRVHCADILHCPIVGDGKYGAPKPLEGIARKLHLHAQKLEIPHPSKDRLVLDAALPEHMEKSWALLGFDRAPQRQARKPQKSRRRNRG